MIDSTKTMRELGTENPLFAEFLVSKGFPFSVSNPVTQFVTFDDVVSLKKLDKDAFLAEFEAWAAERGGADSAAAAAGAEA